MISLNNSDAIAVQALTAISVARKMILGWNVAEPHDKWLAEMPEDLRPNYKVVVFRDRHENQNHESSQVIVHLAKIDGLWYATGAMWMSSTLVKDKYDVLLCGYRLKHQKCSVSDEDRLIINHVTEVLIVEDREVNMTSDEFDQQFYSWMKVAGFETSHLEM